ncbi:MAG TPA: hypothetical protein VFU05_13640 [Cyclobacteriaceae bacterium]|nr:hypothetical protein [Cyclobacteriaceae bacterium]
MSKKRTVTSNTAIKKVRIQIELMCDEIVLETLAAMPSDLIKKIFNREMQRRGIEDVRLLRVKADEITKTDERP